MPQRLAYAYSLVSKSSPVSLHDWGLFFQITEVLVFFFFCFVFFLFCCVFLALIDFVSRSYMYCRGAWPPSSARPFLRNPWIQAQYYGKLAIHHISRFFFSVLKKIQFSSFYFFHSSSLRDSTGAKFLKSYSYNVDPISTKLHDRYVSHGGI